MAYGGRDVSLPLARLAPSFVTVAALCCGLLSIKSTLAEQWQMAMLCIVAAGLLDAMDGKVARMLGTDSVFGAQLDSLCDLLNFGLCPAVMLYMWGLSEVKIFGWALVMVYVACMAIRLARFNAVAIKKEEKRLENGQASFSLSDLFFTGVPAPAAATLLMLPIMLSLSAASDDVFDQRLSPAYMQVYMFIVSMLLVIPVPTFSLKILKIPRKFLPLAVTCFALLCACTAFKPWTTLPIICVSYMVSIPFSALTSLYVSKTIINHRQSTS